MQQESSYLPVTQTFVKLHYLPLPAVAAAREGGTVLAHQS